MAAEEEMKKYFRFAANFRAAVIFPFAFCVAFFAESCSSSGENVGANVVLDNVELNKTSCAVVIPKGKTATVDVADGSYWDKIVFEGSVEEWRGVFVQNRKIILSAFCMGQYPVTQELFEKVMGYNPCLFKDDIPGESTALPAAESKILTKEISLFLERPARTERLFLTERATCSPTPT